MSPSQAPQNSPFSFLSVFLTSEPDATIRKKVNFRPKEFYKFQFTHTTTRGPLAITLTRAQVGEQVCFCNFNSFATTRGPLAITLTRAQVGEQVCFCNFNSFALRPCTLYFQSSVFQYLTFDISCLLFIFKIGQSQSMVTIRINLVGPESPMLHTKFQDLRPFQVLRRIFKEFLPYMGMANILII